MTRVLLFVLALLVLPATAWAVDCTNTSCQGFASGTCQCVGISGATCTIGQYCCGGNGAFGTCYASQAACQVGACAVGTTTTSTTTTTTTTLATTAENLVIQGW